jgi:hypothetical protein
VLRRPARKRVLQTRLGGDEIAGALCVGEPLQVDERGPGHQHLRHADRLNHRGDLSLERIRRSARRVIQLVKA